MSKLTFLAKNASVQSFKSSKPCDFGTTKPFGGLERRGPVRHEPGDSVCSACSAVDDVGHWIVHIEELMANLKNNPKVPTSSGEKAELRTCTQIEGLWNSRGQLSHAGGGMRAADHHI